MRETLRRFIRAVRENIYLLDYHYISGMHFYGNKELCIDFKIEFDKISISAPAGLWRLSEIEQKQVYEEIIAIVQEHQFDKSTTDTNNADTGKTVQRRGRSLSV